MSEEINPSPASSPVDKGGDPSPAPRTNSWLMNGMILGGIMLMVVALAGLFLTNRPQQNSAVPVSSGPVRAGMRLSGFTVKDINGSTVHLSDYAGRPVLVNAWATWCPPCRAEMPALNSFYQQYRDKGFVVLAVNAGETPAQASDFAKSNELTFPILTDPDEHLMDQFGIHDYPTSFLIGKDGVIKLVHIGMLTPGLLEQDILPLIQ